MRPLFIFFILLFLTQSCHNRKPISNEEAKDMLREAAKDPGMNAGDMRYSFDLPAGWSRLDTALQGVQVTYLFHEAVDDLRPLMNVSNEWMHGKGHEEYVIGTRHYLSNELGAEFVAEGAFTTRGGKALWYSYNRTYNGVKRACVYYSIAEDGVSYNITAAVNAGGMPTYRPVFDSIVKSFAVGKDFTRTDSGFVKWLDSAK
jgi:hypothetical protein